jgi:Ca2+-binding RTX toxin-like protein
MLEGLGGNDKINGDFGNDTINGGADNDTISGGGGNDVIDGGAGNDAIAAGDGDDRVKYDAADGSVTGGTSADNNLEHLGNLGDVLEVSDISINLGTAGAGTKLTGFETVDLSGGAANSVTLSAADVISFGDGTFNPEGALGAAGAKDAIKILGDAGDSVTLTGGGWFEVTDQVSDAPAGFKVYAHDTDATAGLQLATINAYVIVEAEVTVNT